MTGPVKEVDQEVRQLARVLWDFLVLPSAPEASDIALVLGSHDRRVAKHAATLWRDGWAPLLVISGGRGKATKAWGETEAAVFARIAREAGVPDQALLIEEAATNTGENVTLSHALLESNDIPVQSGVLVTKPYMARRALATAEKQWPEVHWTVSVPEVHYDDYPAPYSPEREMIELMTGDLERLRTYASLDFQLPVDVPDEVWAAHLKLGAMGFDRYLHRSL